MTSYYGGAYPVRELAGPDLYPLPPQPPSGPTGRWWRIAVALMLFAAAWYVVKTGISDGAPYCYSQDSWVSTAPGVEYP